MNYGNEVLVTVRFEDPGHSWLRVPKRDARRVGFTPSSYSYQDQTYFYLEEDCDAPKFKKVWCSLNKSILEDTEYQEDCFVRKLNRA